MGVPVFVSGTPRTSFQCRIKVGVIGNALCWLLWQFLSRVHRNDPPGIYHGMSAVVQSPSPVTVRSVPHVLLLVLCQC